LPTCAQKLAFDRTDELSNVPEAFEPWYIDIVTDAIADWPDFMVMSPPKIEGNVGGSGST